MRPQKHKGARRRLFPAILAALLSVAAITLFLPYPQFSREIAAKKASLLAGSRIFSGSSGSLEYAEQGSGPPVLVLHGAGGGYDQGLWLGRLVLGDGYRFIAVSRFGYLRSPIPADASISGQARLYRELLDYLGVDKVIVIGISAGGPSAACFASSYPGRCSALLLLSAVSQGPQPGDKAPFYVGIIHLLQQSDYAYWLVTRYGRREMLSLVGIPPGVYSAFSPEERALAQEMLDTMHPMTARYAGTINDEAMIRREEVDRSGITAPVLILHGRDDALVSFSHAEHASRSTKGARLQSFDSGGHGLLPQISSMRRLVREFLATATSNEPGEGLASPQ
ncbi:alpha/beta hydrolase [bacterium]|nr:alpha/beta hydrolase [bacterium]